MSLARYPFIYGTVVTSFLALLISVPLGVGAAIYLSELATPKVSNALDVSGRTAGRSSQRHLRTAGHLYAGAADAQLR